MADEFLVQQCAPTLAGLKTGNLFSAEFDCEETMREEVRALNRKLLNKGLCTIPVRVNEKRTLIYLFRPDRLKDDLQCEEAREILSAHGYECESPMRCVVRLVRRLSGGDFPHEIGLFLGYPPEDVRGFIENKAGSQKFTGYWKVYGDAEKAKRVFQRFRACTMEFHELVKNGMTVDELARIGMTN